MYFTNYVHWFTSVCSFVVSCKDVASGMISAIIGAAEALVTNRGWEFNFVSFNFY